jgi:rhamnogalacturonyl hydrolase YesR
MYMAPPFIAYFGALQQNLTLLREAYTQCALYRDALLDESSGLWRHIALGSWQDDNHWATGNGWAAAGMMRVLATLNASTFASELQAEQANLTSWVGEVLTGVWAHQVSKI